MRANLLRGSLGAQGGGGSVALPEGLHAHRRGKGGEGA